jgi:predicted site-specific integrase-resolvase
MTEQLNTAAAAKKLGISPSWISKLVKQGRLTPVRKLDGVRGPFLFDTDELERYKDAS